MVEDIVPNFHCDDDWNNDQCLYDAGDCCDSVIRAERSCVDCVCVEDGLVHPIQRTYKFIFKKKVYVIF